MIVYTNSIAENKNHSFDAPDHVVWDTAEENKEKIVECLISDPSKNIKADPIENLIMELKILMKNKDDLNVFKFLVQEAINNNPEDLIDKSS